MASHVAMPGFPDAMHSVSNITPASSADERRHSPRILLAAPTAADTAELSYQLLAGGYRVSTVLTLAEALQLLHGDRPMLWLLDARLLPPAASTGNAPEAHGDSADVGREWLRRMARGVSVILYFPYGATPHDRMAALERGADHVLAGPLEPRELLLHISAVLRRDAPAPDTDAPNPLVSVDENAHEVRVLGKRVHTTRLEFTLLRLLVRNAGRLLSQDALKVAAWGHPAAATDHALREHVSRLRAKLGPAASCLETVRGSGFRFRWPETKPSDSRDMAVARLPGKRDG